MVNRNSGLKAKKIAKSAFSAFAIVGLMTVGGCSSSTAPPAQVAAMEKVELRFSIDQCQPLDANLYKCPAVDKPICNPDYNGQAECVRIGPKGSVFVQSGFAN
jgi:hypothetical protein